MLWQTTLSIFLLNRFLHPHMDVRDIAKLADYESALLRGKQLRSGATLMCALRSPGFAATSAWVSLSGSGRILDVFRAVLCLVSQCLRYVNAANIFIFYKSIIHAENR